MRLNMLGLVCSVAALVAPAWGATAVLEGQTELVVASGASVAVDGEENQGLKKFVVDGTLTLANANVKVTGNNRAAIGSGEGLTGAVEVGSGATFVCEADDGLYVGVVGGRGALTVAAGGTFKGGADTKGRIRVGGNVSAETRELASYGTLTVAGLLDTAYIESAPYYPSLTDADTDDTLATFPQAAEINILAGGVLRINRFQANDRARTIVNWAGTIKATANRYTVTDSYLVGGGGLELAIPADATATFDSDAYTILMAANTTANRTKFRALTGSGRLVKKGAGSLAISLGAANTFTGPITVEAGTFALGRALAEGQTVLVKAGAKFVPATAADLAQVTMEDPTAEKPYFQVIANMPDGIDLVAMSDLYRTDGLEGPVSGTVTVTGPVTHAEGLTAANPFVMLSPNRAETILVDTGLENVPVKVGPNAWFTFKGTRTIDADKVDYIQVEEKGLYKQYSGDFIVNTGSFDKPFAITTGNGAFECSNSVKVGNNDGNVGAAYFANTEVKIGGELRIGANDSTRSDARGKVTVSNATMTVNGSIRFAPSTLNDGSTRNEDVRSELVLQQGAVLKTPKIQRNDDPATRVVFDGGKYAPTGAGQSLFISSQEGRLFVDVTRGNDLWLDWNTTTNKLFGENRTTIRGEGGFRKSGTGRLELGDSGSAVVEYQGDTVFEGGSVYFRRGDQIPDGEGKGELYVAQGVTVDFNGCNETVNALHGLGVLGNFTSGNAMAFGLASDNRDLTLTHPIYGGSAALRLEKKGTGTLTMGQPAEGAIHVMEGAVRVAAAPAYKHYRLQIAATRTLTANMMQLAEIRLYDGETDVTGLRSGLTYNGTKGTTCPNNEAWPNAFDGNINTKWLDFRLNKDRSEEERANCWVQVDYAEPQRVTHFTYDTANDSPERDPIAFNVYVSNDGETFTLANSVEGLSITTDRKVATGRKIAVAPCLLNTAEGSVLVESNAKVVSEGGLVNGTGFDCGRLEVAGGVELLAETGKTWALAAETVSGTGTLVKSGAGTVIVSPDAALDLTGDLEVKGGTLSLQARGGVTADKYFRFTFKKTRDSTIAQFSEFYLYDADGNRVNGGLTMAETGTAATALAAGTFAKAADYGHGNNEDADKLFDGNTGTKWCATGTNFNWPASPLTWRTITMRLADDAAAVASYTLHAANDQNGARNPVTWVLESSADGVNWTVRDVRNNLTDTPRDNYAIFPTYELFCGATGASTLPNGAVSVAAGATLATGAQTAYANLKVDCASAGTISGFSAAPGGKLTVENLPADAHFPYELPLTLANIAEGTSVRGWKVDLVGRNARVGLSLQNGKLVLGSTATVIFIR